MSEAMLAIPRSVIAREQVYKKESIARFLRNHPHSIASQISRPSTTPHAYSAMHFVTNSILPSCIALLALVLPYQLSTFAAAAERSGGRPCTGDFQTQNIRYSAFNNRIFVTRNEATAPRTKTYSWTDFEVVGELQFEFFSEDNVNKVRYHLILTNSSPNNMAIQMALFAADGPTYDNPTALMTLEVGSGPNNPKDDNCFVTEQSVLDNKAITLQVYSPN